MDIVHETVSVISARPRFTSSLHPGVPATGFFSASSSSPAGTSPLTVTTPLSMVIQFFLRSQPIAIFDNGCFVSSPIGVGPLIVARTCRSGRPAAAYFFPSSVRIAVSTTFFSSTARPRSAQRCAHCTTASAGASSFSASTAASADFSSARLASTRFSFIVRSIVTTPPYVQPHRVSL